MTNQPEILDRVEGFLREARMAPSTFGMKALNDRHFVSQLRSGRECLPKTQNVVLAFMRGYREGLDAKVAA